MPYVTVQITREGTEPGTTQVSADQKAALFKGISDVLWQVLGKPPEWTWVVVQEVEPEDWGWGGLPVLKYRARLARNDENE